MGRYLVRPLAGATPEDQWEEVFLVYWWPGREYEDFGSLPAGFKSLVSRCVGSKSKYLVYASALVGGVGEVFGYSRCMDIDNPSKKYGRNKALGWLQRRLLQHDHMLVKVE